MREVVGSSKFAFNFNKRATLAALPALAARYIFVRPQRSRALTSAGIAVVVVAIESACVRGRRKSDLFVLLKKKRERNEQRRKTRNQTKTDVYLKIIIIIIKTKKNAEPTLCFGELLLWRRAGWKTTVTASEKYVCFQSRRCALRRQLAPVVTLLSDDKERVVRATYIVHAS